MQQKETVRKDTTIASEQSLQDKDRPDHERARLSSGMHNPVPEN